MSLLALGTSLEDSRGCSKGHSEAVSLLVLALALPVVAVARAAFSISSAGLANRAEASLKVGGVVGSRLSGNSEAGKDHDESDSRLHFDLS